MVVVVLAESPDSLSQIYQAASMEAVSTVSCANKIDAVLDLGSVRPLRRW